MTVLRIVFCLQLALMLPAFGYFISTPVNIYTGLFFFWVVLAGAATGLFALWQLVAFPPRRWHALATLATPVVCASTPLVMQHFALEPIPIALLIGAVTIALLIASIALLAHPAGWKRSGPFASSTFNNTVLQALVIALVMLWLPVIVWLATRQGETVSLSSTGPSTQLGMALVYFVSVAAPAAAATLFTLLYAPVGLFRNAGGRGIHALQLLSAIALSLTLGITGMVAGIAMVNPG